LFLVKLHTNAEGYIEQVNTQNHKRKLQVRNTKKNTGNKNNIPLLSKYFEILKKIVYISTLYIVKSEI